MGKRIWELECNELLYERLVKMFGPCREWDTDNLPSKEKKEEYDKFCDSIAGSIGASSGEAVKQQIAWATTKQTTITESYVETWYRNKIAAFHNGFIDRDYLPKTIVCEF